MNVVLRLLLGISGGNHFVTGEAEGSLTPLALPDIPCHYVTVKAKDTNDGETAGDLVYVGKADVTVPDGTGDVTSGYPLAPSEQTPVLHVGNLKEVYIICDSADDDIAFIVSG